MDIVPKCIYCKHNDGEDKEFGFMWKCKLLGYSVAFGYGRRRAPSDDIQHCKALFIGKGSFLLDKAKYKEYKIKKANGKVKL